LAEHLRETHGMILYEEDIMMAIAVLTGWPLEKADQMRAALVSAGNDVVEMRRLEQDFLTAALGKGINPEEAVGVWRMLARFVAYSFNKAHATSYARLAWETAFLKTHYPVELACAVLNSYGGLYPLRTVAADFSRHGVRLLAPHVNLSAVLSQLESGAVRVGLAAVKHLTIKNRRQILDSRPFADIRDFLERVPLSFRELEALVLCGACDGLAPLGPETYPIAHEELVARLKQDRSPQALQGFIPRQPFGSRRDLYTALVRIRNELNFLSMHLYGHPMHVLREEALRAGCVSTAELPARKGQFTRIAGVVAASRRLATRGGKIMQFVTFEDEHGLVEAVLFPEAYASLGDPVSNPGPYLVGGRVALDHGDLHLLVSELTPFHERPQPYGKARCI
jgi:DNA polymerase-3 subunit alpha/error-prone DNA polymerase